VFIPTAQTLPLSAVMQFQEQLQEHLKAQAAQAAKGRGGTLALPVPGSQASPRPQAGSQASPRPLAGQPQPAPLARTMSSTGEVPVALSTTRTSGPAPVEVNSGKKLRVLLIVLTLVLIGIVIALVSTVRSS